MSIFSIVPFLEDIGLETINKIDLSGKIFDIHGRPVAAIVKVALNKNETKYKEQFNLSGSELQTVSDEITGVWTFLLPDNFHMPLDSYYRITLNDVIFRKFLPDFPPENTLNELENY